MAISQFDIVVIGGGMVGSTAAISLAKLGLSVALVEAIPPQHNNSPSFDQRSVALSASSVAIFRSLGLWQTLQTIACPIKHILVSDQGHFGTTRLHARDYDLAALGEVIPLEQAAPILWQALEAEPNIQTFCPAKFKSIEQTEQHCIVTLEQSLTETASPSTAGEIKLAAKLVIAADGTYSKVADHLAIEINRQAYSQHALIANIVTEKAHQNRAFERFTEHGPIALLPLPQNRMSLVWCQSPKQAQRRLAIDEQQFVGELQQAFGYRLGKICKVGQRFEYPLSLHRAQQSVQQRLVLLGNAARTLHPIAGQGFNLGLRDIAALTEIIEQTLAAGQDFAAPQVLQKYSNQRQPDWQQTVAATDYLLRLFSNPWLPVVLARNKAMSLINHLPLLKNHLANAAMGFSGRSSRLARGIALANKAQQQPKQIEKI